LINSTDASDILEDNNKNVRTTKTTNFEECHANRSVF